MTMTLKNAQELQATVAIEECPEHGRFTVPITDDNGKLVLEDKTGSTVLACPRCGRLMLAI